MPKINDETVLGLRIENEVSKEIHKDEIEPPKTNKKKVKVLSIRGDFLVVSDKDGKGTQIPIPKSNKEIKVGDVLSI